MRQDLQGICNLPSIEESLPALHIASRLGYETMVKILLNLCKVNLRDENGFTPLHHAAEKGHIKVVRLLLDTKGSEINTQSKSQSTPLWLATRNGHEAVVKLLVNKGANLEAKDSDGWTPLFGAAENGHEAVVKLLANKGANLKGVRRGRRRWL